MKRFFFRDDQRADETVLLSTEESKHVQRVLRLQKGDKVELFDGSGAVYLAKIEKIGQRALLRIIKEQNLPCTQTRIIVGQGIIRVKKMELLLQKCTELGVNTVMPFVSSRSQGNMVQQYRGKGERWKKIVDEACKQCGRPKPLKIDDIARFDEAVIQRANGDGVLPLLFWEKQGAANLFSYKKEIESSTAIILLFGPEGGFTEDEVKMAQLHGWHCVGLGDLILRAETAVMAGVSIVQHHLGNI